MPARHSSAGALVGLFATAAVFAQTPSGTPAHPIAQPSNPSAASSPHQRDVTKTPADEAAPAAGASPNDASTPHQKKAVKSAKKKHKTKKQPPDAPTQ